MALVGSCLAGCAGRPATAKQGRGFLESRRMTATSYSLVGDIGGANARFALVREGEVQPQAIEVLPCSDYENLDAAIVDYLRRAGVEAVGQACLAVASPVQGTQVRMTNNHWRFDIEDVRQQFGWSAFKVINDFTAMALGV